MKFLTAKEAGVQAGLSAVRLTQLLQPDSQEPQTSNGGRRYLYLKESVDRFIEQRKEDAIVLREKRIKKELDGVIRPGAEYMTPTEAAHFTGYSKGTIALHCNVKYVKSKKFYLQRELLAIPPGTKHQPRAYRSGKKSAAICTCGRSFLKNNNTPKCPVCLFGHDVNDEYGVIVPQKLGTRKCPVCGTPLFIGQYTCGKSSCRIAIVEDAGALDAVMVYGGRG